MAGALFVFSGVTRSHWAGVAIWSGVGITITVLAGFLLWHENVTWMQIAGMGLILAGVLWSTWRGLLQETDSKSIKEEVDRNRPPLLSYTQIIYCQIRRSPST
jgi:drug/metabolite transporter (DMT)-like permease